MALKRGIVKLENYQNNWVKEYEEGGKTIQKLLGSRVLEIHHIGSTSIPGLEAKPIIDMLLVIKSFDEIDEIDEILNPYAYENRGMQGVSDRYFFAKGPDGARTHYLHITTPFSDTYYNQIYFKKYLLEHPEYIQKYAELKKDLARQFKDERAKYTAGKSAFIQEVVRLAKKEYLK